MITNAVVFDHRGRTKKGEEGPVEIRVTINRKAYYINTGIKVRGRDLVNGTIINRSDMVELNEQLAIIAHRVMQEINRCLAKDIPVEVAEIRRRIYENRKTGDKARTAFLDWLDEQIPMLNVKESTRKHYITLSNNLRRYDKIGAWHDLTTEKIYEWDAWLHSLDKALTAAEKRAGKKPEKLSQMAVGNYHKWMKTILSRAVKFGRLDFSPYDKLKGEFSRGEKRNVEYLTEDEINAFESLRPVPGSFSEAVRDLFIFQLYTGLSYSDAINFDISNYKKVDGKWINTGLRMKTGVPYVNQLLPQAIDVLERNEMKVPKIDNADYNKELKVLGRAAGIKTVLHSHLARHTFATRMLRLGVKIENVSKMLGHTNITQTQRYAKVLAQSVHESFSMVEEKLKKE